MVAVADADGTERAVHRIQNGARLRVTDGQDIKRGTRIAEWDPYTRPILTEADGTIGFEFKEVLERDVQSDVLARYGADFVHFCFAENAEK